MNKTQAIIIGYSGHAFVAIDILELCGYSFLGYCENDEKQLNPFSLKYLGKEQELMGSKKMDVSDASFFIGIGENSIRRKVFSLLQQHNVATINAIHPGSIISRTVTLGKGVMVVANATINPFCNIGDGVICNTSSSIDHECVIGDFSHICPGTVLCGNVTIGKNCFIGANSVVKQGVAICDNVVIGAGSTVIKNINEPGTYFGNPLRNIIKQ